MRHVDDVSSSVRVCFLNHVCYDQAPFCFDFVFTVGLQASQSRKGHVCLKIGLVNETTLIIRLK